MNALLFVALLFGQDSAGDVERLVREGQFAEALSIASGMEGAEGAWLSAWTRHHGGDLIGALEVAEDGLERNPDHAQLLEQAAWLSASLHRGVESMGYAERLASLGHSSADQFIADAEAVLVVSDEIGAAEDRATLLLIVSALAALSAAWLGLRPQPPGNA